MTKPYVPRNLVTLNQGTPTTVFLCVRPLSTNATILGSLTLREVE